MVGLKYLLNSLKDVLLILVVVAEKDAHEKCCTSLNVMVIRGEKEWLLRGAMQI